MALFLYQTSALDPTIYAVVTVVLLLVTTIACLVPAARAAGSDPTVALQARIILRSY